MLDTWPMVSNKINEHPVSHFIILCTGGYCHGKGLVDYGKRKRVGAGHCRGGAGRRRQRGSGSASNGGTGASGGAVRRGGGARKARKARGGAHKGLPGMCRGHPACLGPRGDTY